MTNLHVHTQAYRGLMGELPGNTRWNMGQWWSMG